MRSVHVVPRRPRHATSWSATALLLVAAACDPAGPATLGLAPAFSRQVGLDQFQQQLDSGPARVRIVLEDTGLVARRVRITRPDQLDRPEKIDSRITGITTGGADSSLTLALGNLTIGFNGSTRFRADDQDGFDEQEDEWEPDDAAGLSRDDGEGEHHTMTAADFVARVQAALDSGRHPAVEARRAAPPTPQAPDDARFFASSLRLVDDEDHPRINLNVTGANLQINGSAPPDAWILVLGLKIEVRTSDHTTELEAETEEAEGEMGFRGLVTSVNPGDNTVMLEDGTVLRLVPATEWEDADDEDEEGGFQSLAEVQAALASGKSVLAKGEGLLTSASPRTFDVIEIRFRVVTATGG